MTFIRREYLAWIQEAGKGSGQGSGRKSSLIYPDVVSVTYRLSDIPLAVFSVTFGRTLDGSVSDRQVRSNIEQINRWSQELTELQIYLHVKEHNTQTGKSKEETRLVFQGVIFAPSIEIMRQSASCKLQMQHWLSFLASGSLLAHYATISARNALQAPAVYAGGNQAAQQGRANTETIINRLLLPPDYYSAIKQDVWANGLKSILASAATMGKVAPTLGDDCDTQFNQVSQLTREALKRIQGPLRGLSGDASALSSPYGASGVGGPLKLRASIGAGAADAVGIKLADQLGGRRIEELQGLTYWSKILNFCGQFGLVLVPRAKDAIVRPLMVAANPGNMSQPDILESSYEEISWVAIQQTQMRGVGVSAPLTSESAPSGVPLPLQSKLYGCHIGSADPNRGMVHFINAPDWLAIMAPVELSRKTVSQMRDGLGTVHSAQQPSSPAPPSPADSFSGLLNQYAKMEYLRNTLANRSVNLAGALRFDIMPGSLVKIGVNTDRMVSQLNIPSQNLAGIVMAASFVLDRQQRIASTKFSIDYSRTEDQVGDPAFTDDEHPLFENFSRLIPLDR